MSDSDLDQEEKLLQKQILHNFVQVYKKEKVLGGGRGRISRLETKRVDYFSPTAAGSHFNGSLEAKKGREMDSQEILV